MTTRNIIVIGGSAGALGSLLKIIRDLPPGFPAAILVVIHTAPDNSGLLAEILKRTGSLPTVAATDGLSIQLGNVYVAPPDHHLLVKGGRLKVTRGPRENGFRPALDPLFRTASTAYGPGVIGIILSGGGDDGVLGLSHVKRRGGIVIAQDPNEAESPSMPRRAIQQIDVDHTAKAADIGAVIKGAIQKPAGEKDLEAVPAKRTDQAEAGTDALDTGSLPGSPTAFRCPECGGALWEVHDGDLAHFQCYVGHTFTPDSLAAEQADDLEVALWTALRALEESSALRRRMAAHARKRGMTTIADSYEEHAQDSEERARLVRRAITARADTRVESS